MEWKKIPYGKIALGCFLATLAMGAAFAATETMLLFRIAQVLNYGWIICLILRFIANKDKRAAKRAEKKTAQAITKEEKAVKKEQQREALEKYNKERAEAKRKRTTPVSARLLGVSAAEYKRSVGSMAVRGAVGSIFGPGGAMIGMATTKNKNVNKDMRRFLVKYEDGHIEEEEVKVGSILYNRYMELLEWDE